LQIPSAPSKC